MDANSGAKASSPTATTVPIKPEGEAQSLSGKSAKQEGKKPKKTANPCLPVRERFDPDEYELRLLLPPRQFPTRQNDVYITRRTRFPAQLARCRKLLEPPASLGFTEIWIHGLGAAVNRAINLALQLKREACGSLDLDVKTATVTVTDELYPLLDDGDGRILARNTSAVHIRVFRPTVPVTNY